MLPITAAKVEAGCGYVKHRLTTVASGFRQIAGEPENRRAGVSASLAGEHDVGPGCRRRVRIMTIVETAPPTDNIAR